MDRRLDAQSVYPLPEISIRWAETHLPLRPVEEGDSVGVHRLELWTSAV